LVPVIEPPPGTFFTTTVGLPGSASDRNGAKNRAHTSDPPAVGNGITNSMVFPLKSAALAAAG
jgi:hypothetical protein